MLLDPEHVSIRGHFRRCMFPGFTNSNPNPPKLYQDSSTVPYNVGPNNTWNENSTYLSPYDWLYGPYAPAFWADNFEALALSQVKTQRGMVGWVRVGICIQICVEK